MAMVGLGGTDVDNKPVRRTDALLAGPRARGSDELAEAVGARHR